MNLNNLAIVAIIKIDNKSLIYQAEVIRYSDIKPPASMNDNISHTLTFNIIFLFHHEPSGDKHSA